MTMTDYITQCALSEKIIQVEGLDDLILELKAQGRNLNQLTMLANMGRVNVIQGEKLIEAYSKVYALLEIMVGR